MMIDDEDDIGIGPTRPWLIAAALAVYLVIGLAVLAVVSG